MDVFEGVRSLTLAGLTLNSNTQIDIGSVGVENVFPQSSQRGTGPFGFTSVSDIHRS